MDSVAAAAIALFQAEAGIVDMSEAAAVFLASDPALRQHYRLLAARRGRGFAHADACFHAGSSHEAACAPAQDYALAEAEAALPFAILSDGCSLAGRTDVGARVLALAARRLLRRSGAEAVPLTSPDFPLRLAEDAAAAGRALDLAPDDMEATLCAVQATPEGGAAALLIGDGLLAARTRQGLEVSVVDWAGNMPAYPCHLADAERRRAFLALSEAAAAPHGRPACLVRRVLIGEDDAPVELGETGLSAEQGVRGLRFAFEPGAADVVAAMSDGVMQVAEAPWHEVVAALMDFGPACRENFVTRRMRAALRDLARRGCRPRDDISVAAIAVNSDG